MSVKEYALDTSAQNSFKKNSEILLLGLYKRFTEHFIFRGSLILSHIDSKKIALAISNSFLRLALEFLGIQTPTPPPRWTPICFDRAFCRKRCSLLILKLMSCGSEIHVLVTISIVCESICCSKFERSSNLFYMLRAFMRKNFKHFGMDLALYQKSTTSMY